jgi:pyruvate dehydrogenase E1 component alpha subunit
MSAAPTPPDRDRLLALYARMGLVREFEDRLKTLVDRGVPVGPVHFYTGQEAVAVGVCAALRQDDWIASTHRGHGHCIAKGVDVRRMMAELYGKVTGTNRGKGGSMHITDVAVGMLGVNPIVGMGTPHAVGAALSARVRGTDQVAVAFFGEGATSMGVVHEAMNLAAVWQLPVVFVCENNGYAQATPAEYALACERVADRAAAYRMPGVRVDGQDVVAVLAAAEEAVRRGRGGEGPSLVECMTYRYHGHHQGDETLRYRLAEEERAARARDPLQLCRERLLALGTPAAALDAVEAQNRALLDAAVAFAESSPLPGPEELLAGVYAEAPR